MDNDQLQSAKTLSRKFEKKNTKNQEHEKALGRSHDEPDRRLKALTAALAKANAQLAASDECLSREIEQRKQTEAALNERLKFEGLLSDLSARFLTNFTE
jgi:NhaP-type Na+/H+ and K+/H+ antiporter